LALQLRYLPIAKRLAEGGEPLKKVGDLAHGRNSTRTGRMQLWSRHAPVPEGFRFEANLRSGACREQAGSNGRDMR
jgi:hypothetical protein